MDRVGVLVTAHDRNDHLLHQMAALQETAGWDEAVVCFMDQPEEPWDAPPPRVRTVHLAAPGLPLAAGRNAAAAASDAEVLVFLDVDCLPDPDTVERLVGDCRPGRVVMADPWYLPPGWAPPANPAEVAQPHPARAGLGYGASSDWHMFWSLGFAVHRADLARVGGFDEGYTGYGGEDTDLAFRWRDAGLELFLSDARVLHQAHAVHKPPLQHFTSIVANARRFRQVWGVWPMEGWLAAFAERGLLDVTPDALVVLREPTPAEVTASRVPDARY